MGWWAGWAALPALSSAAEVFRVVQPLLIWVVGKHEVATLHAIDQLACDGVSHSWAAVAAAEATETLPDVRVDVRRSVHHDRPLAGAVVALLALTMVAVERAVGETAGIWWLLLLVGALWCWLYPATIVQVFQGSACFACLVCTWLGNIPALRR